MGRNSYLVKRETYCEKVILKKMGCKGCNYGKEKKLFCNITNRR